MTGFQVSEVKLVFHYACLPLQSNEKWVLGTHKTVSLTTFCTLLSSLPSLSWSIHCICCPDTGTIWPYASFLHLSLTLEVDIQTLMPLRSLSIAPFPQSPTISFFFFYNCIHFLKSFLQHLYSILHYIITLFSPQSLLGDHETSILWDQYPWFCRPVKEGLSDVPTAHLVFLPRHSNIQVPWATNWRPGPPTPPARAAVSCPPPLQPLFRRTMATQEDF